MTGKSTLAWFFLLLSSAHCLAVEPIDPQSSQAAPFRMAVIGLVHSHAWGHLRNMAKNPAVELAGIADPHADLRELAAKEAPGVQLYDDYRKLLDEKKPQAVWAFVENDRHLEITRACAARGIHLIFEKPMAATHAEARQMFEISRKHGIKLIIIFQMAGWPANYTGYTLAKRGELGKLWRVRAIIGHGGPAPRNPSDVRGQRFWAWLWRYPICCLCQR